MGSSISNEAAICGENTYVTDSTHTHTTQWLHLKVYACLSEQIRKTISAYMIRVCVQHVRVCAHVYECVRVYARVCSKSFILYKHLTRKSTISYVLVPIIKRCRQPRPAPCYETSFCSGIGACRVYIIYIISAISERQVTQSACMLRGSTPCMLLDKID